MRLIPLLRLALLLLPLAALAGPPAERPPGLRSDTALAHAPERIELPALDVARLRAEDSKRALRREPPRYAVQKSVAAVTPQADGDWQVLADGSRVWRYAIHAEGATSVEPGFTRFRLPEGAALYVHGNDGKRVRGPYTHADNRDHGQLWVPIVEGDKAVVELELDAGVDADDVALALTHVLQGYRAYWRRDVLQKDHVTNHCNVDVICDEADDWRAQVRSAAHVNIGGASCSGQMVNNTAFDRRPLFLTANHCGVTEASAPQMKVYWNFENSMCRDHNSDSNGGSGDGRLEDASEGARLLSRYVSSDFALVELDDDPEPAFDVYWSGWDRRDLTFDRGATIHHPQGEEKRISFEENEFDVIDGSVLATEAQPALLDESDARPRSHFEVVWDRGVTEMGSSGGGLWNGRGRLVGQLHGGAQHMCPETENNFDWYGRLWMSWQGGGTPDSRLRDWLDPLGKADGFIDGTDGSCNAPTVDIDMEPATPRAGDTVEFTAQGGGSGLEYAWDLDGDGRADATGRTVMTRYGKGFEGDVTVSAADRGAKCGARQTRQVTVRAPDLRLASQNAQQVAGQGDGDDVPEPGERWELVVTLANDGDVTARNPRAVFTRDGAVGGFSEADDFGYRFSDSKSGNCPYQFEAVNRQGNRVRFTRKPDDPFFNPNDDGGSEPLALDNFPFYDQSSIPSVVMSSNGYLATSATRNGGDYRNKCPLPAMPDIDASPANAGRLAVYHDDLTMEDGALAWSERFDECPRAPDAPGSDGSCRILQWNDAVNFDRTVSPFTYQAILYGGSGQIVYQYAADVPAAGTTPTVGIQDRRADIGLTYGCENGGVREPARPAPGTAVCFFHPDAQPKEASPKTLSLASPALTFANIPAGQNDTARLRFDIPADAACGERFGISLHGVAFDGGFSAGPGTVHSATLGGEGSDCDFTGAAAAATKNTDFERGMYFNPARGGHGVDVHTAGDTGFLTWFTYGDDRTPTWYLAIGEHDNDQIHGELLRFTWDGSEATEEVVGEAVFTVTGENTALFNWTLDGESGGEPLVELKGSGAPQSPNRTGHWFPPSQNGWGMTVNTQGQEEFDVVYFYDAEGEPAWVLGVKDGGGDTVSMEQFTGTCPDCVWVQEKSVGAGTFTRSFSGPQQGDAETDFVLEQPREGEWQRDVTIRILSDPVN